MGGESLAMRQQFRINDLFARKASRALGTPTIVHAWSSTAEPSLLAARSRGIATVLERSSSHMLEQCRLLREEFASLGLTWVETPSATVAREIREYQLADRIFVPSLFVRRSFEAAGVPSDRLFLNGFGVDLGRFKPAEKGDGVFRVIYAGSLGVRKGIHHLTAAFRMADIAGSQLLLVGGATGETGRLIGRADPRIRLRGHVPQHELPSLYGEASVFAMASVEEGQAMVQAQALACGLPLVCTSNTGGEDLLEQGGVGREIAPGIREFPAGIVVPARAPELFAEALRRLAADPRRLAQMGKSAAALAHKDLSWRRYAEANLEQYDLMTQAPTKAVAR
jgi:glycosyltransferase involved in cell wall biosynthesis